MKNTINLQQKQQNYKPEFVAQLFQNLPDSYSIVFNAFHILQNKYKDVYARQDTIAAISGYSLSHTKRILMWLRENKFIVSCYRHKKSCLYRIANIFFNPSMRQALSSILPALKVAPLYLFIGFLQVSLLSVYQNELQGKRKQFRNCLINTPSNFLRMLQLVNPFESESLLKLSKILKLSSKGRAIFSIFDSEVLSFVIEKLTPKKLIKLRREGSSPERWAFKTAKDYSAKEDLPLYWGYCAAYERFHMIPRNASWVEIPPKKNFIKENKPIIPPPNDPVLEEKKLSEWAQSDSAREFEQKVGAGIADKYIDRMQQNNQPEDQTIIPVAQPVERSGRPLIDFTKFIPPHLRKEQ